MKPQEKHSENVKNPDQFGFTLIELILALGILSLVLVAWLGVVLQSFATIKVADNRVVAIKEAQIVLNNVRDAVDEPGVFPANVTAAFPAGTLNPPRTTLPFQTVNISYANPNANPLFVNVRVQYQDESGRVWTETLSSILSNI